MKLDDIKIGEEYATSENTFPSRVRVTDIGKVDVPKRFGSGTKKSKRRKVTADLLKTDGTNIVDEGRVYEAQQIGCLWSEHEERKRKKKERRKEEKENQERRYQENIKKNKKVLDVLKDTFDDFDSRETHQGHEVAKLKGVTTKITSKGVSSITMSFDRFLELTDNL